MFQHLYERAHLLLTQGRFDDAERELKSILSQNPNDEVALLLYAELRLAQSKEDEAEQYVKTAIGLNPSNPNLFYLQSRILTNKKKYTEAESSIKQAIGMYPLDADYFAWHAYIKQRQKNFIESLELADKALSLAADNLLALNVRSTALIKLDRKEESFLTIEGALREDPNNSFTLANYGWGLLEKGEHKKSLEYFKESLKNDPVNYNAQAGMMEALKARNPIYRLFLKYGFWMSNLTQKNQWAFIIAVFIGPRIFEYISNKYPATSVLFTPLIILFALFALSTWIIKPISDLFLRFNPYGRYLLSEQEKKSSNFVFASIIISLIGVVCYFVLKDDRFFTLIIAGFACMISSSIAFNNINQSTISKLLIALVVVLSFGLVWSAFYEPSVSGDITLALVFSLLFLQFKANYHTIREDN